MFQVFGHYRLQLRSMLLEENPIYQISGHNINNYVVDTSKFGHSLHGSVVQELEEAIADYVGAKYACSVSSATSAIFLAFLNKSLTVSVPSMIPPVVLNALINSGNQIKFRFFENSGWCESASPRRERFLKIVRSCT